MPLVFANVIEPQRVLAQRGSTRSAWKVIKDLTTKFFRRDCIPCVPCTPRSRAKSHNRHQDVVSATVATYMAEGWVAAKFASCASASDCLVNLDLELRLMICRHSYLVVDNAPAENNFHSIKQKCCVYCVPLKFQAKQNLCVLQLGVCLPALAIVFCVCTVSHHKFWKVLVKCKQNIRDGLAWNRESCSYLHVPWSSSREKQNWFQVRDNLPWYFWLYGCMPLFYDSSLYYNN